MWCSFSSTTPIGLMKCTLNNVYRAILTRYDRDPRKSDNAEKPWFFLWFDVPGSAAEQHASNEGSDVAEITLTAFTPL
jgi:hypothetical protein